MKNIIITIDGPAASGKSSLANSLAKKINFSIMHSGIIYRAMAKKVYLNNLTNQDEIIKLACSIKFEDLNDSDLMKEEIGKIASSIAKHKEIRLFSNMMQHDFCKLNKQVIIEGRDAGTVVFPNADLKIFITADISIRANRRFKELQQKGNSDIYEDVLEDMKARDLQDTNRENAPLCKAEDAFLLDTSNLNMEESFNKLISVVNQNLNL